MFELNAHEVIGCCKLSVAHPSLSPTLGTDARIFLDLFQDLASVILLAVGGIPINSEKPMPTSSILRTCRLILL